MLSIILFSAALSTNVLRSYALGEERQSRIVETAQGPVKGHRDPHYDIFTFYGIPYATAPKGVDRYKAPLPEPSWLTPFNAVTENIFCPQYKAPEFKASYPALFMTEDCLVANVYVPNTPENNLPVMVVIHGGAFQIGSGTVFQPKTMVRDHNIIVVTFNYRLGVHGFLCLGTEAAPGNAGLKDQLALLRWVNKNIASFGGNPEDVTLSGYSAGSVSVNLHMLSTSSKGLFNKVIADSGSSIGVWSVQTDPLESAQLFAQRLNVKNTADVCALEKFYTTASIETITSVSFLFEKDCTFYFSPCLETNVGQKEIFLTDIPNILKSGQFENVPLLVGFTNGEGLIQLPAFDTWKNDMNENFSAYLPHDLQFRNKEEKEKVANTVKHFYFRDKKVGDETILKFVDYFTDVMFTYPILKEVQFYVNAGLKNVFLFEYNYVDELTPIIPHTLVKRPGHTAETFAVYDPTGFLTPNLTDYNLPENTKKHRILIRQIWSNFIKTGVPIPEGSSLSSLPPVNALPLLSLFNFLRPSEPVPVLPVGSSLPSWPPVGAHASPHMSLGLKLELRGPLLQTRWRFWNDIYQKHRRLPEKLSSVRCGKDLKFYDYN